MRLVCCNTDVSSPCDTVFSSFTKHISTIALLAIAFILSIGAFAQTTTSSISGTVLDTSKAVVSNAKIVVTNESTKTEQNSTSNGIGFYTITNLPPGLYTVSVSASGFSTVVTSGIHLDPNIGTKLDVTLNPGATSTTVTVEANANALQTESAAVGQLINSEQVASIQLNGRNPIYLSQLEPGVVRNAPMTSFGFKPDFGGPDINGARADEILITLDGAPMIRTRANGTTIGVADTDSISQVQILGTAYPAQYGGTSGGLIVQVPKTGTSSFHGNAYEYLRNSFFNANTWQRNTSSQTDLSQHPSPFRYNQYGWNLNGPIYIPGHFNKDKSKLFFLVGQEYVRFRQSPTQKGSVPTHLMRSGNFSELLGSNIFYGQPMQVNNPATGVPYVNNIITSGLSPNGLGLLNAYPEPNETAPGYNWLAAAPYPQNQRKDTLVLDYNLAQNHELRFSLLHFDFWRVYPFSGGFNRTPEQWKWPNEIGVLHYTWTISPTLVNNATASASVDHVTIDFDLSSGLWDRTKYGINYPYLFAASDKLLPNKIPTIIMSNFSTLSGEPYPSHSGGTIVNLADNLTKVIGQHTLTIGGLWQYSGENNFDQISISQVPGSTDNQNGEFSFTNTRIGLPTSGVAAANTALGLFDTYGEIGKKSYTLFRANMAEIFAQDQWHVTPKLVTELGVRYTMIQPYYALWGNQSTFDPKSYVPGKAPIVDPVTGQTSGGDPYNGVVIPGSGFPGSAKGHISDAILTGYSRLFRGYGKGYTNITWSDIQPRAGLTYQVNPSLVVRAGAGRFVQHVGITDTIQLGGNSPFQLSEAITAGNVDNPGGSTANTFPLSLSSMAYKAPNPEAWGWTASMEQEFKSFANLTLSYVGRRGLHLQQLGDINQPLPGATLANPNVQPDALRPYQGFSSILETSNRGSSMYNAMQASLKRRMTKNVLFGVAYTWSKLLDYGSGAGFELPNYYDSKPNWGPADFDVRSNLVVNYVWDITYANHASSMLVRSVLSKWQVSGVTQAQTGQPMSVSSGDDFAGVGPTSGGQMWMMSHTPTIHKTFAGTAGAHWFDPSVFYQPTYGTFAPRGTRNPMYAPGFQSWNIAMLKNIYIVPGHDNHVMIFKAEAFNFTNHPNLDTPDTIPNSGTFGQVTSKGNTYSSERQIQFSLRYQF